MKVVSLFIFICLLISSCCANAEFDCSKCDMSEVLTNDSIANAAEKENVLPQFYKRFHTKSIKLQSSETYRLLTMHSFNRYFQVYTISKTKSGGEFLIQEYFSRYTFPRKSHLVNTQRKLISEEDWKSFKKVVDDNCFWTLPILDLNTSQHLDGGEWDIEGFQPYGKNCSQRKHLIIIRKSPFGSSDRFHNVYKAMMKFVDRKKIHEIEY